MNKNLSRKIVFLCLVASVTLVMSGQNTSVPDLLNQGRANLDAGDYQDAIAFYHEALKVNNQDPEIHHELALAFYRIGNYSLASRHMNRSMEYGFGSLPEANLLHLLITEKSASKRTTRKAYDRAMVKFPGTAALWLQYGIYLASNNHGQKSIDILSKAVILDPLYPMVHLQLGLQCMKSRQYLSAYYALVYFLLVQPDTIPGESLEIILQNTSNLLEGLQPGSSYQKTMLAHDPLFSLMAPVSSGTGSVGQAPVLDIPAIYQIDPSKVNEQSAWAKVYLPFFGNLYADGHLDALQQVIDRKSGNPAPAAIDPKKIVSFADWLESQWSSHHD